MEFEDVVLEVYYGLELECIVGNLFFGIVYCFWVRVLNDGGYGFYFDVLEIIIVVGFFG